MTVATLIIAAIFAACGVMAIIAAATNAAWFFSTVNVRALTGRLRRPLARAFYGAVGGALIGVAIHLAATTIHP